MSRRDLDNYLHRIADKGAKRTIIIICLAADLFVMWYSWNRERPFGAVDWCLYFLAGLLTHLLWVYRRKTNVYKTVIALEMNDGTLYPGGNCPLLFPTQHSIDGHFQGPHGCKEIYVDISTETL